VFIGLEMDEARTRARLDARLLHDSQFEQDSRAWEARPNPFPALQLAAAQR